MVDFFLQATVNNLLVSALLALIAWIVQTRVRSASLVNLLWALVLIKLVTPPIYALPLLELPRVQSEHVAVDLASPAGLAISVAAEVPVETPKAAPAESIAFGGGLIGFALASWAASSLALAMVAGIRIVRFHRSLLANAEEADGSLSRLGRAASDRLELGWSPAIRITPAQIAPFVWWSRGRAIVVLPRHSVEAFTENDLLNVLAHEMAHIKRRDHWFRWLEWLAIVFFWWNPIMWWARQQLRIAEEMACDDLVLRTHQDASQYANTLLNMAELLAARAVRPPVVACAVNSGGNLERRLKMILSKQGWQISPMMRIAVISAAVCLFPLGFVYGQETRSLERRLGGAIEAGELTLDEAKLMLETLRQSRDTDDSVKDAWRDAKEAWNKAHPRLLRWHYAPEAADVDPDHLHDEHEHAPDPKAESAHKHDPPATVAQNFWRRFTVREGKALVHDDEAPSKAEESAEAYLSLREFIDKLKKEVASAKLSKEAIEQRLELLQKYLSRDDHDQTDQHEHGTIHSDGDMQGRFRVKTEWIEKLQDHIHQDEDHRDDSSHADDSEDEGGKPEVNRFYFAPDNAANGWRWFREYQLDRKDKEDADEDEKESDEPNAAPLKNEQASKKARDVFDFYMNVIR
ncbi:MAG: M56 family metallopeptidase [Planctomycetota bacterium]